MRKNKRGPSLFEVLGEKGNPNAASVRVPVWHETDDRDESAEPSVPANPVAVEPVSDGAATSAVAVEIDGDRIRFSLTSGMAAIAVFAALVVVVGTFAWGNHRGRQAGLRAGFESGRTSYEAATVDEIEAARNQPAATYLVSSLIVPSPDVVQGRASDDPAAGLGATTSDSGSTPKWISGYTYIVVQEFSARNAASAGAAQEFLARYGVSTHRVEYESGAVQLMTTQGFNRKDPAQRRMADQLKEKIHTIGTEYFAAGGGYRLEGYFKTLKRDHW